MQKYKKLFEPGRIGKLWLRNRIVMAPMATNYAELDGRFSEREKFFFVERAKGGAGLIITGPARPEQVIDPSPVAGIRVAKIDSNKFIGAMHDTVEAVHDFGARIALQISPGYGYQSDVATPEMPPVSASAIPAFANPKVICRPLSRLEIEKIVQACAEGAKRAAMAEFDAIEIHGHTGYLVDQFMSPLWNKREDEYGGDLEGRLRFPLEIIYAMREAVGKDFPIIFRMAADLKVPGGRSLEESQEIARRFVEAGIDALHIDAGCYEARPWIYPPSYLEEGCLVHLAEAIKKVVSIPVIAVGAITPDIGEKVLEEGKADFVASARGFLADPYWPRKLKEGRPEDIKPCIRCNEKCAGSLQYARAISCTVNPQTGKENYYRITQADAPKKVMVVGGGPAGMEAARVAATKGHKVVLYERDKHLGGQLRIAAVAPFKKELIRLIEYYRQQLDKLQVEINLGVSVTPDMVNTASPDILILATGGRQVVPDLPGVEMDNVVTSEEVYLGRKQVGNDIAVAGGGLVGCEIALFLALEGKKVKVVEMRDDVALDLNRASRAALIPLLREHSVSVMTGLVIEEFQEDGLLARDRTGQLQKIPADTVVLALGTEPVRLDIRDNDVGVEIISIGDCVRPRKIGDAIREGFAAAWQI